MQVLRAVLDVLAHALHDEGYLDLQDTFIDGSSQQRSKEAPVQKEAREGLEGMAIADRYG